MGFAGALFACQVEVRPHAHGADRYGVECPAGADRRRGLAACLHAEKADERLGLVVCQRRVSQLQRPA